MRTTKDLASLGRKNKLLLLHQADARARTLRLLVTDPALGGAVWIARHPADRTQLILNTVTLAIVLLLSDVCSLSGLHLAIQRRQMLAECFSVTKTPRQQIASAQNQLIGSKLCVA